MWLLPSAVGVWNGYILQRRQRYKFYLVGANWEVGGTWVGVGAD